MKLVAVALASLMLDVHFDEGQIGTGAHSLGGGEAVTLPVGALSEKIRTDLAAVSGGGATVEADGVGAFRSGSKMQHAQTLNGCPFELQATGRELHKAPPHMPFVGKVDVSDPDCRGRDSGRQRNFERHAFSGADRNEEHGFAFYRKLDLTDGGGTQVRQFALESRDGRSSKHHIAHIQDAAFLARDQGGSALLAMMSQDADRKRHAGSDKSDEDAGEGRLLEESSNVHKLAHLGLALLGGSLIGTGVAGLMFGQNRKERVIGLVWAVGGAIAVAVSLAQLMS